jgi:hypothetical protein
LEAWLSVKEQINAMVAILARMPMAGDLALLTDKDFTHVISGYSAAFSIMNAFKIPASDVVKCGDVLSIGKQNLNPSYDEWAIARKAALAEAWNVDVSELFEAADPFDLFHNFDAIGDGKPVLLWLDRDLNSHLMAAFICCCFKTNAWNTDRIHAVRYERAGREIYNGMLAVLNDDELKNRRPKHEVLSPAHVNFYAEIWTKFAGQNLADLISVCVSAEASSLSMDTLRYVLRRLPSRFNGLNEIEHELLRHAIDHAPDAAKATGYAMGHDETPDMVGDLYLSARLKRFGSCGLKHRLVEIDNPSGSIRECRFRVLPLAHQILSGKANMIELNGLDDWIGGVHLTPDSFVYREDILVGDK